MRSLQLSSQSTAVWCTAYRQQATVMVEWWWPKERWSCLANDEVASVSGTAAARCTTAIRSACIPLGHGGSKILSECVLRITEWYIATSNCRQLAAGPGTHILVVQGVAMGVVVGVGVVRVVVAVVAACS